MFARTLRRGAALAVAIVMALGIPAAGLAASPPLIGTFPIGSTTTVLEPESSMCGFDISAETSGLARFQALFDQAGDLSRVLVHAQWTGSLSANGITLQGRSSLNQMFDLEESTVIEVGLVFMNSGPGTGVALMDRGRLVWSVDPDTGEWIFPPVFEAGPHPQLHGDITSLCEALER